MKPLSVIIASYNQSETVLQSIHTLQEEAMVNGYEMEIVICDDGSPLNQLQVLLEGLQSVLCPVRLVWQKDVGFRLSASRNNGLKLAAYELIIFIDGDCIPSPGFLAAHLQHHSDSNGTMCVGKRRFTTGKTGEATDFMSKLTNDEDYDIRKRVNSKYPWEAIIGRNFSISPASAASLFDEVLVGWGVEEIDFSINCYKQGFRQIVYCPTALVTQHHNPDESKNPFLVRSIKNVLYSICNALWIMKKHEQDERIYFKLAFYLFQYTIPFEFTENDLLYSDEKAYSFYKNSNHLIPKNIADIKKYHQYVTTQITHLFTRNPHIPWHPYIRPARPSDITIVVTPESLATPIEQLLMEADVINQDLQTDLVFSSNRAQLNELFRAHQEAVNYGLTANMDMDMLFLYDFRRKRRTTDIECLCRSARIYRKTIHGQHYEGKQQ